MMRVQKRQTQSDTGIWLNEGEAISWWRWRPGTRPGRALLYGSLLTLLALFLLVNGVALLIAGVLDSFTPPLRVSGQVTGHSKTISGSPQLTIHLQQAGLPTSITLEVLPATAMLLPDGTMVRVDYGPHLHLPYALETAKQSYALPGTGRAGHLIETFSLLIFGLALLPYPALLCFWAWRDLRTRQRQRQIASVVALRKVRQTTTRTPGLVPRTVNTWYGVALRTDTEKELLIFALAQDLHARLHVGERVEVTYSPHLHYLYALTQERQSEPFITNDFQDRIR